MTRDGRPEQPPDPGALGPVEPIRDPFLGDYLRKFRRVLEGLLRAEGDEHRKAVEQLCELSRDILLRLQPVSEYPPKQREEVIALFDQAIGGIRVPAGDRQVAEFRDHIRERANEISTDSWCAFPVSDHPG